MLVEDIWKTELSMKTTQTEPQTALIAPKCSGLCLPSLQKMNSIFMSPQFLSSKLVCMAVKLLSLSGSFPMGGEPTALEHSARSKPYPGSLAFSG